MTHFGKKRSFANTLSSIFHCPPSILLKLSTIFLGSNMAAAVRSQRDLSLWKDMPVCCPYGSSPISKFYLYSVTRWQNDILSGIRRFFTFQKRPLVALYIRSIQIHSKFWKLNICLLPKWKKKYFAIECVYSIVDGGGFRNKKPWR